MSKNDEYVPRLTVEISEETHRRMTNMIPWGLRGRVIAILLDDVLDLVALHGDIVIAAIVNRQLTAKHVVTEFREKELGGKDATV